MSVGEVIGESPEFQVPDLDLIKRGEGYVAVIHLGSQSYNNIATQISDLGAKPVVLDADTPVEMLANFDAVVLSGSGASVYEEGSPRVDRRMFKEEFDVPVLGICFGMQLMAYECHGEVTSDSTGEYGKTPVVFDTDATLSKGINTAETWMSHGDYVDYTPLGFEVTARSPAYIAAMENKERGLYGVQFHPESGDTEHGFTFMRNFLRDAAGIELQPQPRRLVHETIRRFEYELGAKHAVLPLSGGVDSMSLAGAAYRSGVPRTRLHPVHMDHGAMRRICGFGESEIVMRQLDELGIPADLIDLSGANIFDRLVEVRDEFGEVVAKGAISQTVDPEQKRLIFSQIYANQSW